MLDFLELEETVGRAWHRLVGNTGSWPRHPDQAVRLEDVRPVLAVCFRGFGGEGAVQIAPARGRTLTHRLRLRQRVGLGEEKLVQPGRDHATVMLPGAIDLFPDRALNRDLYVWLAAAMALMPLEPIAESDPLLRDLDILQRAEATAKAVLEDFPGLARRYRRLCAAALEARQPRPLPSIEHHVENRILSLLRKGAGLSDNTMPVIFPHCAPAGYLPMLPVPLWPDALLREEGEGRGEEDQPVSGGTPETPETGR
ncbi:MAG: protein norD, partial [Shinella sp.]